MTETTRPPPFFLAEDTALDFLNSVASPWGQEIEWITDGGDLLSWLEAARLVPAPVLERFGRSAERAKLNAVAVRARELREDFRAFVGNHAGRALTQGALDDLNVINGLLADDHSFRQIEAADSPRPGRAATTLTPSLRWRHERRWNSPDVLLLPLAQAIGELVCRPDFELVKLCEGPTCTLWFYDVSKNHTRRWCSMAVCGNRAKAAAHRARQRQSHSPPKESSAGVHDRFTGLSGARPLGLRALGPSA